VRVSKWLVLAAIGLAVVLLGREVASQLPTFARSVQELGFWGPVVFVLGYAVAALVLAPAFLLTIAAGAIWGLRLGVIYVFCGATLGAVLAFLSGRYFVRRFVERYVNTHPRLAAIDRAVEGEGLSLVFLLRLSPVVSYVLLNYILGITRLKLRDYLVGMAGMLPTITAYVYAGKVAGDVASIASGASAPKGPLWYTVLTLGLAATVAVTVTIGRIARRAVDRET
jgi:uncharacterized membrane protein YdjX (TVP38/TMEM64 family)